MSEYSEPWRVSDESVPGIHGRPLSHVILDRYGYVVKGTGTQLKKINTRVVACVNFLQGVDNAILVKPAVIVQLIQTFLQEPSDLTRLCMLKDEIQAYLDSVNTGSMKPYVTRAELIQRLEYIAETGYERCHNGKSNSRDMWNIYTAALEVVGVTCPCCKGDGLVRQPDKSLSGCMRCSGRGKIPESEDDSEDTLLEVEEKT